MTTAPTVNADRLEAFSNHLLILAGLRESTVRAYVRDLELWDASGLEVGEWAILGANSSSTVTRRMAAVKRWCRFNKVPDLTAELPRPKARHGIPRPVADVEFKIANLRREAKLAAIFLLETGMRISEAYSLDLGRSEFPPPEVTITGKGGAECCSTSAVGCRGRRSPSSGTSANTASPRTSSATPTRHDSLSPARTWARSRTCSVTPPPPRPRSTRSTTRAGCGPRSSDGTRCSTHPLLSLSPSLSPRWSLRSRTTRYGAPPYDTEW